jgi:hypothetical protein
MGSVGKGGSVGPSKTRSRSSPFSHRTSLSELLKIRVSLVRRLTPVRPSLTLGRSPGATTH